MPRKRVLLLGALLAAAGIGAPTTMILMSDHRDAADPPPTPPRIATQPAQPAAQPIVAGTPAPVSAAPVTEVVTTSPPGLSTPALSTPALSTPGRPATTLRPPDPLTIEKPVVQVSAPPPPLTGDPVAHPPPPLTGGDDEPPG